LRRFVREKREGLGVSSENVDEVCEREEREIERE